MTDVDPREALEYALGRDMLTMYGLYVAGYVLFAAATWLLDTWAWRGGIGNVAELLAWLLYLAGFLLVVGATIGIAYKVIADATDRGRERTPVE